MAALHSRPHATYLQKVGEGAEELINCKLEIDNVDFMVKLNGLIGYDYDHKTGFQFRDNPGLVYLNYVFQELFTSDIFPCVQHNVSNYRIC